MKVFLSPTAAQADPQGGIGQVILAQSRYLPEFDIELVSGPEDADIIAAHIEKGNLPRVDVLHCHGLYWADVPHAPFSSWHHKANRRIIDTARQAAAITVPSAWVAQPFKRDMRISPAVIHHGVDVESWNGRRNKKKPYVLWNKNRNNDVCDPMPAYEVAQAGITVVSTFAPEHIKTFPETFHTTGPLPHSDMQSLVEGASIYLATTIETFGIGTLEALAAGVPVVGYDWGGTRDIIHSGIGGILVEPGDTEALIAAIVKVMRNWSEYSEAARERALDFTWLKAAEKYAAVYRQTQISTQTENDAVSVVITNYNYADYVTAAMDSALATMRPQDELIVVDDGSTDGSPAILRMQQHPQLRIIYQANAGVAAARNAGVEAAKNELITCLDADDLLHVEFIPTVAPQLASSRDVGVAFVGLNFMDAGGKPAGTWEPKGFDWFYQSSAVPAGTPPNTNIPTPSACMFRKSMWRRAGGYYQQYAPGEDTEFMTRGLSVGFKALPLAGRVKTYYRQHGGGASKRMTYGPIHTWHPWMVDRLFPMGAPTESKAPYVLANVNPLVSVIIPVGPGHEDWLFGAIDSVLAQTWRSWEVILVNDTGGPLPAKSQDRLEQTYPFVQLVENAGATGPGGSRNTGIKLSRSPLLLFLDADDFLAPGSLKSMVTKFSESEGRYVYGNAIGIDSEGDQQELVFSGYNPEDRLHQSHPVTVLIQREHAAQLLFNEKLKKYEDWDFFVRCAIHGFHGVHSGEAVLYIRDTAARPKSAATQQEADEARDYIRGAYVPYFNGEKKMGSCCGGGGQAVIRAKQTAGLLDGVGFQMSGGVSMSGDGLVRMQFVGQNKAARTFVGKNRRRSYRGGDNPLERFSDVHPEDVPVLLATGMWIAPRAEVVQKAPVAHQAVVAPGPAKTLIDWQDLAEADENVGKVEKLESVAFEAVAVPPAAPAAPEGKVVAMSMEDTQETGSEITGMSAKDAIEAVADADRGTLLAWMNVESEGKRRKTVLEAIETALG